jgi:hypothetical protein
VYGKSINDKSKQNQQMEIGYYRGLSKECWKQAIVEPLWSKTEYCFSSS